VALGSLCLFFMKAGGSRGGKRRGDVEVGKGGGRGSVVGVSGEKKTQSLMEAFCLKAAASSQKPASKMCTR